MPLATRKFHPLGCSFNHMPTVDDILAANCEAYLEPLAGGLMHEVLVRPIGGVRTTVDEAWSSLPVSSRHSAAVALWGMEKAHLPLDMNAAVDDLAALLDNRFKIGVASKFDGSTTSSFCWLNFPSQLLAKFHDGSRFGVGDPIGHVWRLRSEIGPSKRWFDVRITAETYRDSRLEQDEIDGFRAFVKAHPPVKKGPCQHEAVNVSAFFRHMVCKHCDIEMPDA